MKLFFKFFIYLFLFVVYSSAYSQNVDSLLNITKKSNEINKINAFFQLSKIYKYDSIQISEGYALQALNLSEKIKNDTLIVTSINGICPIWLLKNKTDSIFKYYKKAVNICNNCNYKKGLGITYNNIGSYYNKINKLDSAIIFYLDAAKIFEELKLYKVASSTYNNAGIIFYKRANYGKSLDYFIKSLKIKETVLPDGRTVANDAELAASMVNIGLFYYKLNNYNYALSYLLNADKKATLAKNTNYSCIAKINIGIIYNSQQKYDSALFYLDKALILADNMNNLQRKSEVYSGLANVYTNTNKFDLAIKYSLESLKIHEKNNDIRGISVVEKSIAELYLKQNNLELAKEYGLKSFNNAKLAKNIDVQISISKTLSLILEQLKDYKQALFFENYYNHINDSISAINSERIITEMQTKYETAKKNNKIKELKIKDIKNQNAKKLFIFVIISLFLIALLLIFFFRQKIKSHKLLNQKNIELNELNETQNRLMSIISHDFKAPLSAFYSITSSLKSKINNVEKTEISEYLERMQNSSLGLKLQLENMLNWAISQSTKIKVNKNCFNLSILAQKTAIILGEFAKEKNISIKNSINENLEINTDGKLLSVVLNNLITNAIKFSNDNGIIEISAKNKNNKVFISVKDFGVGISPENLKLLFKGKINNSQNENRGTGLGLIVSKDIIEKLGGTIRAESKLNIGTTFYIELNG